MRVRKLVIWMAALWACGCGSEEPVGPGGDDTPLASRYLPMKVGATWVYRKTDVNTHQVGDRTTTVVDFVDVGASHPGKQAFRVRTEHLDGWSMYWQGYQGAISVRYRSDDFDLGNAMVDSQLHVPYRLKLDESAAHMAPGANYAEAFDDTTTDSTGTETKPKVAAWSVISVSEHVDVPAGSFDNVLHVRRVNTEDATPKQKDYWYVRGVGKVKEVGDDQIEELVSWSLPPE